MPPTNLPAHLQNRNVPNLTARALEGLGASLPPHISIQGNQFTLIDASGNEQPMGPTLEACIVDMADVMCKRYYENDWTPGSDEPPTCWSMNGLAPSRDAMTPQSPICASCPKNVRGSATSKLSGASIKACRDEKPMALLSPQFPTMLFQLVLTPGSFKNWSAYMKQFEQHQVNLADVLTQFSFQAKANGVLEFRPSAAIWIDQPTAEARDKALAVKATDALVGRLDRPIQAALAAPANDIAHPQSPQANLAPPVAQQAVSQPFGQSASPLTTQPQQGIPMQPLNGGATAAFPSDPPAAGRRPRRTKAQIEADNAAGASQGQQTPQQPATATEAGFQPAPFRPNPAPEQGTSPFGAGAAPATGGQAGGFGIQAGVAPNPELKATLDQMFGKQ